MHRIEVHGLQELGHWPPAAAADGPVVHLANRRHLCGRACEKGLIGKVYLVTRDALFTQFETDIGGQTRNGIARDSL